MNAVIDVGSNTVRLLIGECRNGALQSCRYERRITRLAGGLSAADELAEQSMERTLLALLDFSRIVEAAGVEKVKAVGTAALRRALNGGRFVERVRERTGIAIEIIDGAEEARLMTGGVLSVIDPVPQAVLVIDIGGGSTELVCVEAGRVVFQKSYPLGVVQLCEECDGAAARRALVDRTVAGFGADLAASGLAGRRWQAVGTAGTITTLAAVHLGMRVYDPAAINNHRLETAWLAALLDRLKRLSVEQREALAGMEEGRGDLIVPGLEILERLFGALGLESLVVADAGLLEGALLDLCRS